MKTGVYVQRIRLGRNLIKAEIDGRKSLELMLEASERVLLPEEDNAQAAAELFAGIFGVETAQRLLDFYGEGKGAEKRLLRLLRRILKRSARAELKRQAQAADSY